MGLYSGGLIIGRIFASEVGGEGLFSGGLIFIIIIFFWGGEGGHFRNFMVVGCLSVCLCCCCCCCCCCVETFEFLLSCDLDVVNH